MGEVWGDWHETAKQYDNPSIYSFKISPGIKIESIHLESNGALSSLRIQHEGEVKTIGHHKLEVGLRQRRSPEGASTRLTHLSGDQTENNWSVIFHWS